MNLPFICGTQLVSKIRYFMSLIMGVPQQQHEGHGDGLPAPMALLHLLGNAICLP